MTAGMLAGCGALFDDTGPGSSSDAVAAKSPDPSRYPAQANGGGSISESTIPGERGSAPAADEGSPPVAGAPAPTPAPAPAPVASAPPAGGGSANPPPPAASTPAPAPVAGTISNSIDTIVNDMKLMNDMKLAGVPTNYGWANGPGHVLMGNDPRGTNTPSWWQVNNSQFKGGNYWNAILPWFVVFDGVGNAASNTRVQLRNLKLYIKSKSSGRWNLIRTSTGVSGEIFTKTLQGTNVASPNVRTESDGSTAVLPPNGNLVYHGWGSIDSINGSDVAGLFITMQARLVKDSSSGPDDRPAARYLVHVGADYYPEVSTRISDLAPAYYFPGAGVSRAKLVGNDWQSYNFSTIDVGVEDPGGGVMTEAQFRAAPPPLQ